MKRDNYALVLSVLAVWIGLLAGCQTGPAQTPDLVNATATVETAAAPSTITPPSTGKPASVLLLTATKPSPVVIETAKLTPFPSKVSEVEMVLIEAGEFLMGSSDTDTAAERDEKPQHEVFLNAFYIDRTEVTNAMYRQCVDAGYCTPPEQVKSSTHAVYYGNPDFDDYPVIYVSWSQAASYCGWRKARLPSEAQWEKAARGTDGRIYPWGAGIDCTRANYGGPEGCRGDVARVGSFPDGASPYGLLEMSGNVWEWVNDWYLDIFYEDSPINNPKGPSAGERRILRGGAWITGEAILRTANRQYLAPSETNAYLGFRCVRST